MIRRGPRRGVGLVRSVARTAVVAGTAQSVAGRVAARQQAAAEKKGARPGKEPTKQGMLTDEAVDQLKKLADLRDAGVLTEKEFAAKKAKILD